MAWLSFMFIFLVGGIMLLVGLLSDGAAVRIEKLSFLIGTIFGVFTTIVVSYFGASTVTDRADLKYGAVERPPEGQAQPPAPMPQPGP